MSNEPSSDDPPQRKPNSATWESYVEAQIRKALEQGKFEGLSGFGKPIAGIDAEVEDDWWLKKKLREEKVSIVHPLIAVRSRVEAFRVSLSTIGDEDELRHRVDELNVEIRAAIASPLPAPPISVLPLDVDEQVQAWRRQLAEQLKRS